MIRYLLDTNIVSLFIRNGNAAVVFRMQTTPRAELAISTITEAELRFGIALLPPGAKLGAKIDEYLQNIPILPWDSPCAAEYGTLAARQQQTGMPLSVPDAMIAAHALAHQLTLVSNDGAFKFVEGLSLQDWTKGPQSS